MNSTFRRVSFLVLVLLLTTISAAAQDEIPTVAPMIETVPSPGDGATGVHIWVHPTNPAYSLILGADDDDGLGVYNLSGELLQFLEIGGVKHVDVRYNVLFGDRRISVIATGIEDSTRVQLYTVNEDTLELEFLTEYETGILQNGLCMYQSPVTGRLFVFSISDDGTGEQWWIDGSTGDWVFSMARALNIGSEAESCTVDDQFRFLYATEESVAIWRYGAEPEQGNSRVIVDLRTPRGHIEEEVETLTVYQASDGTGYLIAANQSANSFLVYDRRGENAFIGEFSIGSSDAVDQVSETAGITVVNLPLGDLFPEGLFVAQDDTNSSPNADTNFKLVSWREIANALGLTVDTTYDVRLYGVEVDNSIPTVVAALETDPVGAGVDAADDPALWIHPTDRNLSLIIGTDKTTGLVTYNLDGSLQQLLAIGRVNNVDLRHNFDLDGVPTDLVVTTNRTENSLQIFRINPETRMLEDIAARAIPSAVEEVYGVCMYVSPVSGDFYVFVNSAGTGEVEQYRLFAVDGRVDAEIVRGFLVGSQTEGCAADDELGTLYMGEEGVGFWRYNAEPDADFSRVQVDNTGIEGHLTADVEGIAIYYGENGTGYILVSSQGNSQFAVYTREGDNAYIGSFTIVEGGAADGVSGTDGIDVLNAPFGDQFPNGIFVAQDDLNINPSENQNFKLVDWALIAEAMGLEISTTTDPRA